MEAVRIWAGIAAVWAAAAMAAQAIGAWRGGRREYSQISGNPWRGIAYNFTGAMLPWKKETASLHWMEFSVGVILHLGVVWALAAVLLAVIDPAKGAALLRPGTPVFLISLAGALALFIRRAVSPLLRSFSAPDDYLSSLGTALLLVLAAGAGLRSEWMPWFLGFSGILLLYMPLGKLRHAVFFYLARSNYGRRLGYRGVYPPAHPAPRARASGRLR